MLDPARLTAQTLRLLPRKRMSWAMGRLADVTVPGVVLDPAIAAFVRLYGVDLSEAIVPPGGFASFDDFFTRRLQSGARPIDSDPRCVVSPADGRLEDMGAVDTSAQLTVKGQRYRVAELLGDAQAAEQYAGGTFFIVYLSPRDYHRVHAPVSGSVLKMRHIPGTLYPVNRIGLTHVPQLFARNERVAIVQDHAEFGEVTTVMVGAIGVGRISVTFDDVVTNVVRDKGAVAGSRTYGTDGPPMTRGEELGVFHLGSTAIVFLPRQMSLLRSPGTKVRLGEAIARAELDE